MEPIDLPLYKTLQTLPAFPFANIVRQSAKVRALLENAFFSIAHHRRSSFINSIDSTPLRISPHSSQFTIVLHRYQQKKIFDRFIWKNFPNFPRDSISSTQ